MPAPVLYIRISVRGERNIRTPNMAGKKALIVGSSGLVGQHCLEHLLESDEYDVVYSFVRTERSISHPKLKEKVIDMGRIEEYLDQFEADDVYCSLGTTMKKAGSKAKFIRVDYNYVVRLARLSAVKNAKNFCVVSAVGADPSSKIFYNKVKGEMENTIKKIDLPSVHVFRPSFLLGKRQETRFWENVGLTFMKIMSPFLLGPLKKYRPSKGVDVAKAMISAAKKHEGGFHVYDHDDIEEMK